MSGKHQDVMRRFWRKTSRVPSGCLLWVGAKVKRGYGTFSLPRASGAVRNTTVYAHRFIYERTFGALAPGLDVMHSCDTPACVELTHLSPGTRRQNMEDAVAKGRTSHGERRPTAKLTAENVRGIRILLTKGQSQAAIAARYGVQQMTISFIAQRKTWKHVV